MRLTCCDHLALRKVAFCSLSRTVFLAPPTEDYYSSCDELLAAAKDWPAKNSYAMTIAHSNTKERVLYIDIDSLILSTDID